MSGSTNIIGYGSDSITLLMAEDQAAGEDAQFTVNVDGQQIGGVQTVTASQSAGQTESFTFLGDYGPGTHNATVTFANNFIYPGASGDRNLYVDGVTYDGQTVSNSTTAIYNAPLVPPTSTTGPNYGNAVFQVNDTTPVPAGTTPQASTTPGPVSIGDGADTLVLNMAEDAYLGDSQFTVSVDGQQIGGTQTTTASFNSGQAQEFDVHGNFGSGTHTVTVDYLNDLVGGYFPPGTPDLPPGQWALDTEDRNLYVIGVSLDGGAPSSDAPWELSGDGPATFSVTAGSNSSATNASSGLFASDGAAATGNNIAVSSASIAADSTSAESSSGMSFLPSPATDTSVPTDTASTTISPASASSSATSGSDTLTINAAAYAVQNVDPQFVVYLDGNQVGDVNTVTATEYDGSSNGGNQAFSFSGNWGAGPHTVGIDYFNNNVSATGDAANLFVNSIGFNGSSTTEYTQSGSTTAGLLYQGGTANFYGITG